MARRHTTAEGETVLRIARRFAFRTEKPILTDANNAELRSTRPNPNVLAPGDAVFVPDLEPRFRPAATGRRNVFVLAGRQPRLELTLLGRSSDGTLVGLEGCAFVLDIDGQPRSGVVGSGGRIVEPIPYDATTAELTLTTANGAEITCELKIGFLQPVEVDPGVQMRLSNLGFYSGEVDGNLGDPAARDAMRAFLASQGVDGVTDDALFDERWREQLRTEHGS